MNLDGHIFSLFVIVLAAAEAAVALAIVINIYNNLNTINIDDIQALVNEKKIKKELTIEKMIELRLVNKGKPVKILGRGKIDSPVNITANKFSATAEKLIEKAGGKITKI